MVSDTGDRVRRTARVRGVVQGVGFRPYVHALATSLGLSGAVGNDLDGVFLSVEGPEESVAEFLERLPREAPHPARVDGMGVREAPPVGQGPFRIVPSPHASSGRDGPVAALVPPDVATCEECLAEILDPTARRFRYPFTSCARCGPRFTIIRSLPYDRERTTMAGFPLCADCRAEYADPTDRRFHAQSLACPACGPRLEWLVPSRPGDTAYAADALAAAQRLLATGRIVAVKGLGGYHLACDARNPVAVALLRARKARGAKPFAVMARDVATAEALVRLDDTARALLASPERPIVVAPVRRGSDPADLADLAEIAPATGTLGVMLPYTPLHHLLLEHGPDGGPAVDVLVMTSGNRSDEPIAYDDADALDRLGHLADAFLRHDRPIAVPCDDSVVRAVAPGPLPVRRSRGYAPLPVGLRAEVTPVLAVGAELKNTLCVAAGRRAWLSQHIGDLASPETLRAFESAADHLADRYGVRPEIVACDEHPGYLGTRWARGYATERGLRLVGVQHHHAHVASLLAEHGADPDARIIGVAFDGTGYGRDGAVWGGEFLLADLRGFSRVAHLAYVPLPGGDAAVRNPYRMALAHLRSAGFHWDDDLPPVAVCDPVERGVLARQFETGFGCVPTSSMGRLFDAVASLLGVQQSVDYEAQAAIELEALAASAAPVQRRWRFDVASDAGGWVVDPAPVIQGLVADLRAGSSTAALATAFHASVAAMVVDVATRVAAGAGVTTVGLTGGVFQNAHLLASTVAALADAGLDVLIHRVVPPNDGGLALGQAAVAGLMRVP